MNDRIHLFPARASRRRVAVFALAALGIGAASQVLAGTQPTPTPTPPPVSMVFQCRQAAEFLVKPDRCEVTVNGRVVGIADDYSSGRHAYRFPRSGWYTVRFRMPGYMTTWVRVEVDPRAEKDVAKVKLKMPRRPFS